MCTLTTRVRGANVKRKTSGNHFNASIMMRAQLIESWFT